MKTSSTNLPMELLHVTYTQPISSPATVLSSCGKDIQKHTPDIKLLLLPFPGEIKIYTRRNTEHYGMQTGCNNKQIFRVYSHVTISPNYGKPKTGWRHSRGVSCTETKQSATSSMTIATPTTIHMTRTEARGQRITIKEIMVFIRVTYVCLLNIKVYKKLRVIIL